MFFYIIEVPVFAVEPDYNSCDLGDLLVHASDCDWYLITADMDSKTAILNSNIDNLFDRHVPLRGRILYHIKVVKSGISSWKRILCIVDGKDWYESRIVCVHLRNRLILTGQTG